MASQPADVQYDNDAYGNEQQVAALEDEGKNQKRTSKYRGVCWNKKNRRWQASINVGGRYHYLGSFMSEDQAARAFDKAAYEIRGKRAKLNFPESQDLLEASVLGGEPASIKLDEDAADDSDGEGGLPPPKRKPDGKANARSKRRLNSGPSLKGLENDGAGWTLDVNTSPYGSLGQVMPYNGYMDTASNGLGYSLGGVVDASSMDLMGGTGLTPRGMHGQMSPSWGPLSPNLVMPSSKNNSSGGEVAPGEMPSLGMLFNGFGQSSSVLKLLPHAYNQYKLLGAVIENCRDSEHFGAAVWDGKRMHTLEGFTSAEAAESSAIDVINMLSTLACGKACTAAPDTPTALQPSPRMLYGIPPLGGADPDDPDEIVMKSARGRAGRPRKAPGRKPKAHDGPDTAVKEEEPHGSSDDEDVPPSDMEGEAEGNPGESEAEARVDAAVGDDRAEGPEAPEAEESVEGSRQRKPPKGLDEYEVDEPIAKKARTAPGSAARSRQAG